jgi:hypothetical protein
LQAQYLIQGVFVGKQTDVYQILPGGSQAVFIHAQPL